MLSAFYNYPFRCLDRFQSCSVLIQPYCLCNTFPKHLRHAQGNCNEDPTVWPPEGTAVLREFLPQQCMLLADVDLLKVVDSNLWVDQLYVRFMRSDRQPATVTALAKGQFFHFLEVQVRKAGIVPALALCTQSLRTRHRSGDGRSCSIFQSLPRKNR